MLPFPIADGEPSGEGKEASSKARLMKLADTPGPLGSVRHKHPHRAKALRDHLNQPSAALSGLRRMVSIDNGKLKYGNPTPGHTMTANAQKIAQARNDTGKKCALRAKSRTNWTFRYDPIRSALQGAFRIISGASHGVTLCAIWGHARYLGDLVLVSNRHESYLSIPIAPPTYRGGRRRSLGPSVRRKPTFRKFLMYLEFCLILDGVTQFEKQRMSSLYRVLDQERCPYRRGVGVRSQ